jgi:hypothetical protein
MAEKFPELKSIALELGYFDAERAERATQIKYTFNMEHAKSVFRIDCQNSECVGGDFDLSEVLAEAVAERRTTISDELRCRGWRSHHTIDSIPCGKILRYKLTLGY